MFKVFFGENKKKSTHISSFLNDIKSGFSFILASKELTLLILSMVPIAFCGKVFEVLVLSLSEQKWGIGELGGIGVYLTIFALGGITGSFQIKKWKIDWGKSFVYMRFPLCLGMLFLLLGSIYHFVFSLIIVFFIGFFLNISVVIAQIHIQKNVDGDYLGRVFSAWTFLAVLGGGIGAYLSGALSDWMGVNHSLILIGLLIVVPLIGMLASTKRQ
jgi:DHA3 family macrolide efflux protein-like MFS transporter